jgi:hypothetical protein
LYKSIAARDAFDDGFLLDRIDTHIDGVMNPTGNNLDAAPLPVQHKRHGKDCGERDTLEDMHPRTPSDTPLADPEVSVPDAGRAAKEIATCGIY